jgi:hypothetical protein
VIAWRCTAAVLHLLLLLAALLLMLPQHVLPPLLSEAVVLHQCTMGCTEQAVGVVLMQCEVWRIQRCTCVPHDCTLRKCMSTNALHARMRDRVNKGHGVNKQGVAALVWGVPYE